MLVSVYNHEDELVEQTELHYKNEDTFLNALEKNSKLEKYNEYLNQKRYRIILEGEHVTNGKYTVSRYKDIYLGKWNNVPKDDKSHEGGVLEAVEVLKTESQVGVNFDYMGRGFDYDACEAFVDKLRDMGYTEYKVLKPSSYGILLSRSKFD